MDMKLEVLFIPCDESLQLIVQQSVSPDNINSKRFYYKFSLLYSPMTGKLLWSISAGTVDAAIEFALSLVMPIPCYSGPYFFLQH